MSTQILFPFSALLGQPLLQQALLLAAIDPSIGGVLIEGPRGTAKSTSARAVAELLPHGQFVTLPLGASEEQLIGTLNIEAALQDGNVQFAPGLLAKAHDGVLYVDEVNLLPDALVDQLLDVAASGINVIERDGISHRHAARFVLIGTMNREEGELRPQLLDRFGLALVLNNCTDAILRRDIVKKRLRFDADPQTFRAQFNNAQQQLIEQLQTARAALAHLTFDDAVHDRVSQLCIAAGVDGLRADLVMLRAARALAALQQDETITIAHVDAVAELALYHRRNSANSPSANENTAQNQRDNTDNQAQSVSEPSSKNIDTATGEKLSDDETTAGNDNPWGEMPPTANSTQTDMSIDSTNKFAVKGVKPFPQKKY